MSRVCRYINYRPEVDGGTVLMTFAPHGVVFLRGVGFGTFIDLCDNMECMFAYRPRRSRNTGEEYAFPDQESLDDARRTWLKD